MVIGTIRTSSYTDRGFFIAQVFVAEKIKGIGKE